MSSMHQHIQRDWEHREFVETITNGVSKIADFLNTFDASTRYKLATMNEKLTSLERKMDFVEAKLGKTPAASAAE